VCERNSLIIPASSKTTTQSSCELRGPSLSLVYSYFPADAPSLNRNGVPMLPRRRRTQHWTKRVRDLLSFTFPISPLHSL
jgi:hypothetical protein